MKKKWILLILIMLLAMDGCSRPQEEPIPEIAIPVPEAPQGQGITPEMTEGLKTKQTGLFYFDSLNDREQTVYVEILNILRDFGEEEVLSCLETDTIEKVFQYVLNDHPEIFYVDGYTFTRSTLGDEVRKITDRKSVV